MQLGAQVLQAVAVGVGARQLGGDLGAVDGLGGHAQVQGQHAHIEAGEVEDLEDARVRQQGLQARRRPVLAVELDEMGGVVAGRELDQAQPVAAGLEPQRLRVDGNRPGEGHVCRQVVLVQLDGRAHVGHLILLGLRVSHRTPLEGKRSAS